MKGWGGVALSLILIAGCAGTSPVAVNERGERESLLPQAEVDTSERRRARIRLELAASFYQKKQYSLALEELRKALTIDADYAQAYGMLGLIYMDLNERNKADASFERALALSPNNPDLNNNYGWFLCQTGEVEKAVSLFEKAAADRLYPVPSKALHNAGVCLRKIGDIKGALRYLNRSFKADPKNPVAMFNLGEIYLLQQDFDRARFYAQRLVKTFDPAPKTLWLALRVEKAVGNRDGVLSLGTQLRRRFPSALETDLLRQGKYND